MDAANGAFGEILETGQKTVVNTIQNTTTDLNSSIQSQLGLKAEPNSNPTAKTQGNPMDGQDNQAPIGQTERTSDMIREFYGVGNNSQTLTSATPDDIMVQQKLAQDRAEIEKLFRKQHNDVYFDQINNPTPMQTQERTADRIEREKREEASRREETPALPPLPEVTTKAARGTPPWQRKKFLVEGKDLNSGG